MSLVVFPDGNLYDTTGLDAETVRLAIQNNRKKVEEQNKIITETPDPDPGLIGRTGQLLESGYRESVAAGAKATVTGNVGTGALGTTSQTGASTLSLTGTSGTATLGTGYVQNTLYSFTGVAGTGNVGIVLVYTAIVPSQTPNWTAVTVTTTAWTDTTPSQTPNWEEIAAQE